MRDLNFFSPYIDDKKARKIHRQYAFFVVSLIVFIFTGFISWNIYRIDSLEKNISEKEQYLSSPMVKKSLDEYTKLKGQIERLNIYYKSVSIVDNAINEKDIINIAILDSIAKAMPKQAFLQNISSSGGNIELICNSSNKTAIAELERNLKQISSIKQVHVMATKKIQTYYSSSISISIKDVANYEAD